MDSKGYTVISMFPMKYDSHFQMHPGIPSLEELTWLPLGLAV